MSDNIGSRCIVVRDGKVLMVKMKVHGKEHWCLPGGGIEKGESPEEAALRELEEECCVTGKLIKKTSQYITDSNGGVCHTFYIDIGNQTPALGMDPEIKEGDEQKLIGIGWFALDEICERDRAFLWASGLMSIEGFGEELMSWSNDISYPNKKQQENN